MEIKAKAKLFQWNEMRCEQEESIGDKYQVYAEIQENASIRYVSFELHGD